MHVRACYYASSSMNAQRRIFKIGSVRKIVFNLTWNASCDFQTNDGVLAPHLQTSSQIVIELADFINVCQDLSMYSINQC